MTQWYCVIGGERYGPAAEEQIGQWLAEGRLRTEDLVWTEGMSDWAPASSVPEFPSKGVVELEANPNSLVPLPIVEPTGQARPRQITAQARSILRGRWGLTITFCFVGALICYIPTAVELPRAFQPEPPPPTMWETGVNLGLSILIFGPLCLASGVFFLTLIRGGRCRIGQIFIGFRAAFFRAIGLHVVMTLLILLWSLLLIIPGIIAGLAYSQAFYLLAQNRKLGPLQAITKSKTMMDGHKTRLFLLSLRFLGWTLLFAAPLGLIVFPAIPDRKTAWLVFWWGLWVVKLFLEPYFATGYARFHDDLYPPQADDLLVGPSPKELDLQARP